MSPQRNSSEGSTRPGSLECHSRQAVQTQPGDPDRVVPISSGVQSLVLQMGQSSCRPFCNPVQSQTPQVYVTGTGSNSLGRRHPESTMGESGCLRFPSSLPAQPSNLQSDGSRLSQNVFDSFHRDKPNGRRGVPSWNLSLVLHQLTKAPFEPMRKASLKHLTFKTVILLPLDSGKRRSEIHAWLYKNIRHQENWTQVSLYPSTSFLSKNQLAREGPSCVVIPALAFSLDKSLTEDKSLCLVRALRYYLDRTKDLRKGKDLIFVSFRKSFRKHIVPATISSWIKQTVLCYQLSDEEAQNLYQGRAHDVRAFAASKAFQGGFSLHQILTSCHWKAHNTFTLFYLKDLAWADSELYHLGPI